MYKNKEGYTDPTAGAAMATIMKEYRQNQRRIYRKHSEIKARPKVYVVSKYAGDIEGNTAAAIRYARFAIEKKRLPVVSHLLYPQILDDGDRLTRAVAEEVVEDAADEAERHSIRNVFGSRYDKDGKLILKARHFR